MIPRIDILTLFPEMFDGFLNTSIIKRAIDNGLVEIKVHNFRDYSTDKHKRVDDYPYGGGAGMVLMCEPIYNAIEDLRKENTKVIMLTPSGCTFNQKMALDFSKMEHIILLCGHYEGFDERIKSFVDMEVSIGNYILTGGEIPSMAITDAMVRLIPGVISSSSLDSESFNDDKLDYPNYTRPPVFKGMSVPDVLLSGHHKNISEYREIERKRLTDKLLDGEDNE